MIVVALLLVILGLVLGVVYIKDTFISTGQRESAAKTPETSASLDYRELNLIKDSLSSIEDKMVVFEQMLSEVLRARPGKEKDESSSKDKTGALASGAHLAAGEQQDIIDLKEKAGELESLLADLKKKEQKDISAIKDLKEERRILLRDIQSLQEQLSKFGLALKRSREAEQRLKKEINKQRTICSDAERELKHLKERNQELIDGLNYEVNN